MTPFVKTTASIVLFAAVAAIVIAFVLPGCTQNQDNSPIAITNSHGRQSLSVACSTDGSVAYLTDGRNVYRYERAAPDAVTAWQCILSYTERLELANHHDPREEPPKVQ
jgi:hypothetical protein